MVARFYRRGRTAPSRPRPWYERGQGERFRHDDAIVRAYYSDLAWRIDADAGKASLVGAVAILEPGGIRTKVAMRIDFPTDYPDSEPAVFETGHQFPWHQDRHIIPADGQCCLWLGPRSGWQPDDPDVLHAFLDQVALFFDRQLVCDATGRWPGEAWQHGVHGYWDFIVEEVGREKAADWFVAGVSLGRNTPCPCGSKRRYKRCHLPGFEALARRIGRAWLDRVLEWRRNQPEAGEEPHVLVPLNASIS